MALTDKLTAIANAIRAKTGSTDSLTLSQMPQAISDIETGITPTGSIEITENGTYDVTDKASAVVNVASGGGGTGGQSLSYATGTFIPESNSKRVDITHNLGRIPSFVFVYYTGTHNLTSNFSNRVISELFATAGKQLMVRSFNNNYMIREYNLENFESMQTKPIRLATETTITLYDDLQDDFYAQGFEYKWIMW